MTPDSIFLGIDFGTGGCKVTAISEDGVLQGEASTEYVTEFAHPGWSEQNPADWYAAMRASLKKLRDNGLDFRKIRAVAFDGSTHNAVLLDEHMTPLRKTIMWTDQRSTEECAELKRERGEAIFRTAYQMPAPTWTLPQMMWLKRHEPEVLKKTKHVLFVKDYVRYLVTGHAATDYIEAQGTLFYDMAKQDWADGLVELSGLDRKALPELIKPADAVGKVTAKAAAETGLPEGAVVVCGTSDSAVEDYGAGAVEPGDCIVKLATAGNVNVMTAEPHPFQTTLTYSHVIPGMWYTVSATNAAALCQRWFRDTFCQAEKAEAQQLGTKAFALMDRQAEASAPGAGGVMFHPYLQGERSPYWDPKLRSSFTGVSISSTKGDFIRALFEGVAYSLRDCFGTIEEMKLPVNRIFLIGGGARGKLWSEIVCNVFNLPLQVPTPGDASFGTALLAATGAGVFPDSKTAVRKCLHIDREIQPDPALAAFYREEFQRYRAVHDALAPVYQKTNLK
ncbi:MAG: xylulokinase [Lentisphaerae bacterium]|nr:xylulokinase [Lentisphaerota bacterium]